MVEHLLSHEREAAEIIVQRPRVLLFDAMGTGKTVSVLYGLKKASDAVTEPVKCVVCAPNTLLGQWVEEISLWLENFNAVVAVGDKETREIKYNYFSSVSKNAVLLTNYSLLVKDSYFNDLKAYALILDEGYLIRNRNTKAYQFLRSFIDRFSKVIILSGNTDSFTDQQFYDIASLMFPGQVQKAEKQKMQEMLGDRYISRGTDTISKDIKTDVEPEVIPVPQALSETQQALLSETAVEENRAMKTDNYSSRSYTKKRQAILNSPRILDSTNENSPKEEFMLKVIKTAEGKCVVYCPDRKFFKLLKSDLNTAEIKYSAVSGEMPINIRNRNLGLFKFDGSVKCLLLSGVGKFGLNLQMADTLICMGVPKGKFDLTQVIGRLNRINQREKVVCYIPYHQDTVEEKLIKSLI